MDQKILELKNDSRESYQLLMKFEKFMNSSNPQLISQLYHSHAIVSLSDFPSKKGLTAIDSLYTQIFETMGFQIQLKLLDIKSLDSSFFVYAYIKGDAILRSENISIPETSRHFFLVEKKNAQWKIVRDLSNRYDGNEY